MWRARLLCSILSMLLLFPLVTAGGGQGVEERYQKARELYYALKTSEEKRSQRLEWLQCIRAFQLVWKDYPQTSAGYRSLFLVGRVAFDLYQHSHKSEDLDVAIQAYQWLVERYAQTRLADDAQFQLGEIALEQGDFTKAKVAYETVLRNYPASDTSPKASLRLKELALASQRKENKRERAGSTRQNLSANPTPLSLIQDIRYKSNTHYTRVVVNVDRKVDFRETQLTNPDRLSLDLSPARIDPARPTTLDVTNVHLKGIRAAQYQPEVVRVVLDLERITNYKVFTLDDPFRVVVDITGEKQKGEAPLASAVGPVVPKTQGKAGPLSLIQQLGLGIGKVVIDPGHGGRDAGAIGPMGLMEKDVVLDLGLKLRSLIQQELGWQVVMTRETDVFIPLEDRTAIANSQDADLFISIHANASPQEAGRGIETYFLDLATSPEAMETAARENMTSVRRISDLQAILKDLLFNTKQNESSRLAGVVQASLVRHLRKHYSEVEDRGVKQAPFYVLLGAEMPSILIETSFITNAMEERRLDNDSYRLTLARAILEGLKGYATQTKTLVSSWQNQQAASSR